MSQFLSEIQEKYTKIANLIGFLNQLVFSSILTDSQPLDNIEKKSSENVIIKEEGENLPKNNNVQNLECQNALTSILVTQQATIRSA